MSSTLPRSRSLSSGAASVSSPSLAVTARDRVRPVSLCESSWGRVLVPPGHQARALQRSPSQANNLSTTVPCSLVSKSLGGRHTPTRSSLRHSRMVVLNRTSKGVPSRRWSAQPSPGGTGLGRVGVLVITAQTVVGVVMGGLAGWCMLWAPRSVPFREVPHYAAIPLFVSGVLGAVLLACCSSRRRRTPASFLKGLIATTSCVAIVTCLCVCIFTALHLVYLAPMKCRPHRDVVTMAPTTIQPEYVATSSHDGHDVAATAPVTIVPHVGTDSATVDTGSGAPAEASDHFSTESSGGSNGKNGIAHGVASTLPDDIATDTSNIDIDNGSVLTSPNPVLPTISNDYETESLDVVNSVMPTMESSGEYSPKFGFDGHSAGSKKIKREETHFDEEIDDDEKYEEGSGGHQPEDERFSENLELLPVTSDDFPFSYERSIHVEVVFCVCESANGHWKRTFRYPDLSCLEVNRVLPVLSVATCIVTAGGAVLSGVVLYLLWASRDSFYDPIRPSEIRPIIFSSNLKRNNSVQSKVNGVPYWNGNGNGVPQRNGHSRYTMN